MRSDITNAIAMINNFRHRASFNRLLVSFINIRPDIESREYIKEYWILMRSRTTKYNIQFVSIRRPSSLPRLFAVACRKFKNEKNTERERENPAQEIK